MSAAPLAQPWRQIISPTTTELVIDGAVYSVEGIKQLIARSLTEKTPAEASPADAAKLDVDPTLETTRDRIYREIREKDTAAKEEILTAFVAKYGAEPDEVEVVQNGMHWHVRPRAGHNDRKEALNDRAALLAFFESDVGRGFRAYGKAHEWSPGQTAVHFLSNYSRELNANYTREELVAEVTTNLTALGMPQIVPIVSAYEALHQAVEGIKVSLPTPLPYVPKTPDYEDSEDNDEPDR